MNTFLKTQGPATAAEEEDIDLTPHQHERALMRAYRSLRVSDHFNTQEACNQAMRINPLLLVCVPDHYKTQEMCDKAVGKDPGLLGVSLITLKPKRCVIRQ